MGKKSEIPYNERTDDHKLESNWTKARGHYKRQDWSASVIRAATAAEISANIYVRHFLETEHRLPETYVNALLLSANGLDGKFNRLIKPAAMHRGTWTSLKPIQKTISALHEHRNSVTHSGAFKNKADAEEALENSLAIIQALAPDEGSKLELPYAAE